MLQYIENQTPELCMVAVTQNGLSIRYVINQTPEICLEAIKQHKNSINYINKSIISELLELINTI